MRQRASRSTELTDRRLGVNAISNFAGTSGLAEAGRRATFALLHAGVQVAVDDRYRAAAQLDHRLPAELAELPSGRPYPIDICFLNINEVWLLPPDYFQDCRYSIAYWFWEQPDVPKDYAAQFETFDEIWVSSAFTRDIFASYTDRPVRVMPQMVRPMSDAAFSRSSLGLAEDAFVFFFNFDINSTFARKNPWAVIEAFTRAFSESERRDRVRLVIKTLHLEPGSPADAALRAALAAVNGVLVTDDLTAGAMAALMAGCDAYVSLHRAEGFGLGMAEAMYLGLPVIATAYSGNLQFMDSDSACLVGYRSLRVRDTDSSWDPPWHTHSDSATAWADPDVKQAADWMRLLVDDPDFRTGVARRGQEVIRSRHSEQYAGQMMAERLSQIPTSPCWG